MVDDRCERLKVHRRVIAALNVVCGVKYAPQRRNGFVQLLHALERVAINALLILVAAMYAICFAVVHHFLYSLDHGIVINLRIFTLRNIEAEHANARGVQLFRNLHSALEFLKVRCKVVLNADLADGRADGGNADIARCKLLFNNIKLLVRQV